MQLFLHFLATLQNEVKNYFEGFEKKSVNTFSNLNIKKFNCLGWRQTMYIHNSK